MPVEAQKWLASEIERVLDRGRDEWDVTYTEAIGVLYTALHNLTQEALDLADDREEER